MSKDLDKLAEHYEQEMEDALNRTIEDEIRSGFAPNAIAWIVVVVGSFVINLAVLALVTGG